MRKHKTYNWFKDVGNAFPAFRKGEQIIPWYIHLLLIFKPGYVAIDWEGNDYHIGNPHALKYKYLFGKVYILDIF